MPLAPFALAAALLAVPPSEPAATFTELGAATAPGLNIARSGRDLERRGRPAEVVGAIGANLRIKPTPVTLDFRQMTPAAVVEAIRGRTGLDVRLTDPGESRPGSRLIDCIAPGSQPFWSAIDAICAAGGLRHAVEADAASPTAIVLTPGDADRDGLVSDSGPFRVRLVSVHAQADQRLLRSGGSAGADPVQRRVSLELTVAAEPHLRIVPAGPPQVGPASAEAVRVGYETPVGSGTVAFPTRVDLDPGLSRGPHVAPLRGTIPVQVTSRRAGPTTVPLADAPGRSFLVNGTNFTVGESADPARVALTIQRIDGADPDAGIARPRELDPAEVEILDDRGRPLAWFPARSGYDDDRTRAEIVVTDRSARPAALRFHELDRAIIAIPFSFAAVPLP